MNFLETCVVKMDMLTDCISADVSSPANKITKLIALAVIERASNGL